MIIAVTGNALGTAIMSQTGLGMTAWGSSSSNLAAYFNISLGTGFIVLSAFFYTIAVIIRKKIIIKEMIFSTVFLLSFGYLVNIFLLFIPDFRDLNIIVNFLINIVGLLILLFAIAVHLKVNFAVHPMDVYLKTINEKFNSVIKGTYFSYISAFLVAIVFGLLNGEIQNIGIGTFNTIAFSGIVLNFYYSKVITKWTF
ncbi:hypothetical protein CI105_06845 [Candidatus Izimaplasma bacterium ZiA1]|uniref:DUF6198 family protein n=1 Tax=Candidatus Izimoplasma sp. ZiA1 TaxID=2024899 RepID=UPI000BAA4C8E|nr:hypothetical protein CI105_06845 [Candidatus Izimaplasma bacterium ZiA1]